MPLLRLMVVAAVVVLSSCSSGAGDADGERDELVVEPGDAVRTLPTAPPDSSTDTLSMSEIETPESSPESEAMGTVTADLVPSGSVDPMRDVFGTLTLDEQNILMTEVIATCMIAQGFPFVAPADPNETFDERALDSREWAEAWGFGIATRYTEAVLADRETARLERERTADPMTEGERLARDAALDQCRDDGFTEIARRFESYSTFGDELVELYEAVEADSRVVSAHQDWVGCLTNAGWVAADEDGARDLIRQPMSDIVRRGRSDIATAPTDEQRDVWDGVVLSADGAVVPPLTAAAEDELAELAEEERLLAVAVWDCSAELEATVSPVRLEYERQFLNLNSGRIREALAD